MITVEEYSSLTTSMFSAALGTSTWTDFLSDLAVHADGVRTHMFGFDTEANIGLDIVSNGYEPDYIATYNEYYSKINAWAPGFVQHQVGVAIDSKAMCPTSELINTEFYNDWIRPQENIAEGGGALLFKNDTRTFAIGGNIPVNRADEMKADWLTLVNLLVPQLQNAFNVSRALAGSRLETALVARESLRLVPAIVILAPSGRTIFTNAKVHDLFNRNVLEIDHRGLLSFRNGYVTECIDGSFLRHRITATKPFLTLSTKDRANGAHYHLRFARLTKDIYDSLPLDPILCLADHCTLLLITEDEGNSAVHGWLRSRYGLTSSEAQVTVMVGDGLSIQAIAQKRSVSVFTVRNQVKTAMLKVGVNRQAELVRIVQQYRPLDSLFGP